VPAGGSGQPWPSPSRPPEPTSSSARRSADLEEQATRLKERYDVRARVAPADLADPEEVLRLARDAPAAYGGLDILVNNAGVSFSEPVTDVSVDHWNAVMDVNLRAACRLASRVGGTMARAGAGKIINIASTAGLRALRDH
jgi:short-subunit dehydrogenase